MRRCYESVCYEKLVEQTLNRKYSGRQLLIFDLPLLFLQVLMAPKFYIVAASGTIFATLHHVIDRILMIPITCLTAWFLTYSESCNHSDNEIIQYKYFPFQYCIVGMTIIIFQ